MTDHTIPQLELRFLERGYNLVVERLEDGTHKAEALAQGEPDLSVGPPPTGFGRSDTEAALRCWGELPHAPDAEPPEFP